MCSVCALEQRVHTWNLEPGLQGLQGPVFTAGLAFPFCLHTDTDIELGLVVFNCWTWLTTRKSRWRPRKENFNDPHYFQSKITLIKKQQSMWNWSCWFIFWKTERQTVSWFIRSACMYDVIRHSHCFFFSFYPNITLSWNGFPFRCVGGCSCSFNEMEWNRSIKMIVNDEDVSLSICKCIFFYLMCLLSSALCFFLLLPNAVNCFTCHFDYDMPLLFVIYLKLNNN